MEFIVDRRYWLRGEGEQNSYLLRVKDGKLCCLGFFCLALGVDKNYLRGVAGPYDIHTDWRLPIKEVWPNPMPAWLIHLNTPKDPKYSVAKTMEINDDQTISDETREAHLKEIFAHHGVTVKFV